MRLNQQRQKELEPKRIEFAKKELEKLGYVVTQFDKEIEFNYKGNVIKFFPYSGWYSGKGIGHGRGIKQLIKQLTR